MSSKTSSAEQQPTILIAHGSWHSPIHYQRQVDLLEANGFPAVCPPQPSVGSSPSIGFEEDVQCIRDAIDRLVNAEQKEVIVVGHSYGGMLITQAVDAEFSATSRKAKGLDGGVTGLLYCCAFVPAEGESLSSIFSGEPVSSKRVASIIDVDSEGMCLMTDPGGRFYHDLPPEEQNHWISFLKPCSIRTQFTPITYTAYTHYPATYLVCENDQVMPPFLQRKMFEDAEKATGVKFKVETCTAGHSPFLSQPDAILRAVKGIAGV